MLIDFGGLYVSKKDEVQGYISLSDDGDILEAINRVYDVLRWAETNKSAKTVLIADILFALEDQGQKDAVKKGLEHIEALCDRLFRAASGQTA